MAGKKGAGLTEFDREVLRRWDRENMLVGRTAKALHLHPNTVRYHLNKIMQETGKDPRSFWGLTVLLKELEEGT